MCLQQLPKLKRAVWVLGSWSPSMSIYLIIIIIIITITVINIIKIIISCITIIMSVGQNP